MEKNKYVLFSPVGTHDPIGVPFNNVPSEGSMLHIIRHYKPEIIYLYITKELNYDDNRYEKAIKKFFEEDGEHCEIYKIISEIAEDDVNNYDVFMHDFKDIINEIHEKHKDYEILLNISSGTPQMKSNLILEVISSSIKLIPIQVSTPIKKKNFEDRFSFEALENIDTEYENNNNRCSKVEVLSFKRSKIQSQLESLIKNYEYNAALQIFNEDKNSSSLFKNELSLYLEHCIYRTNWQFENAKKIFLDNKIDILDYSNGNDTKREFFEYFYIMKIKQSKGFLSDFILSITPFITRLLFYFLNEKYKLGIEKYMSKSSNNVYYVERKLIEKHNKELLEFLDKAFKKLKQSNFLNFSTLIEIAHFYHDKIDDEDTIKDYQNIYSVFKYFDRIEINRNIVAHTMINIDENFLKEKLKIKSSNILNKCQKLLEYIFDYKAEYFVYDEINNKILNLLNQI